MDKDLIEIVALAFIAGVILFWLYSTLGRRTGSERPEHRPQPVQGPMPREDLRSAYSQARPALGAGGEGLMAIVRADPQFDPGHFLTGARGAYDQTIKAFAKGDLDALRPLLTPRVFDSYAGAIKTRQETNGVGPELVRLKSAEMQDASLQGSVARITVKFEAELAEGVDRVRDAKEKWTFERDIRSRDPNWRLARVTAA